MTQENNQTEGLEQFSDDIEFGPIVPEGDEITTPEVKDEKPSETESEPEPERDYEAEALSIGWIPPDKWKGDPSKVKDAKKFIEDGENFIPLIKANNRKLAEEREKLTSELATLKTGVDQVKKFHKENLERTRKQAYEQALKDIKAKQRAAAEYEDFDEFDRLDDERDKLVEKYNKPDPAEDALSEDTPPPKEGEQKTDIPDAARKFIEDNQKWFNKDPEMTAYAKSMETFVLESNPHLKGGEPEVYQKILEQVKEKFSAKFQNPRRNEAGTVEGNTSTTTRSSKPQFTDLPAENQAQCKELVNSGAYTQEEYMADYFSYQQNGYVEFD